MSVLVSGSDGRRIEGVQGGTESITTQGVRIYGEGTRGEARDNNEREPTMHVVNVFSHEVCWMPHCNYVSEGEGS